MGECFDRDIKQASLQSQHTTQDVMEEEEDEEDEEKAYKQNSFQTQTCAHPELEPNGAALFKMKVWYPVAQNFCDSL